MGDRSRQLLWWIVLAVGCAWFATLGARHLLHFDEGRYAEIAREMFATGDWVTTRYNGLKYFEKPPFHFWMTALAYHAFGVGDWTARLWAALSGMGGLLITMLAARRWFGPRVAMLTGLALLAAPAWNLGSHFNSLDMSVSGALSFVLAALLLAQHPSSTPGERRAWMLGAWVAMGVAILSKGLIGIVLPGLVLVVYSLAGRDWAVWRRLHILSGATAMLIVVVPWFVLVSARNPEFPHFFFVHEHWERYTTTVHQRGAPFWYFVPQLLVGFLPWVGLLPRMGAAVRQDARQEGFKPALLLAVWVAAIFLFFSLSSSKLPGYIMPVYPALALLAARVLDKLDRAAWGRQLIGILIVAAVALLASPLVGRLHSHNTPNVLFRQFAPWIVAACALAAAGAVAAYRVNRSDRVFGSITVFSLSLFAAVTVGLVGHETLGRAGAGISLVAPIQRVLTPDMPIYTVRMLDHTLPFYLGRTTVMVESADELEFGTQQEPQKWIPTLRGFLDRWSSGEHALAIMAHETYDALRRDNVPMFLIAEDTRRVVVANFAQP